MFDILEADIVVMQETKIQRKDLSDDMVLVPGWDVFFSLPRHKKGTGHLPSVSVISAPSICHLQLPSSSLPLHFCHLQVPDREHDARQHMSHLSSKTQSPKCLQESTKHGTIRSISAAILSSPSAFKKPEARHHPSPIHLCSMLFFGHVPVSCCLQAARHHTSHLTMSRVPSGSMIPSLHVPCSFRQHDTTSHSSMSHALPHVPR